MEFLLSFFRRHLARKLVIASPNVGCFLRLRPCLLITNCMSHSIQPVEVFNPVMFSVDYLFLIISWAENLYLTTIESPIDHLAQYSDHLWKHQTFPSKISTARPSRKRPSPLSERDHFLDDGFRIFHRCYPPVGEHLGYGLVPKLAVCTSLLRVWRDELLETTRNYSFRSWEISCNEFSTNRPFALRGHVTSFLWKWKLYEFAFEKRFVGHILTK